MNHPIRPVLGLLAKHAERWDISEHLTHWTAERTEGTATRFVAAHTAAELLAKLDAIEEDDQERRAAQARIWGDGQ